MLAFRISFSCFLIIICVVRNAVSADVNKTCDKTDKDIKKVTINTSQYCKNNICIYKCCGENEVINPKKTCNPVKRFRNMNLTLEYVDFPITQSLNGTKVTKSSKRLTKDFVFIYNNKFTCNIADDTDEFRIWENGTATLPMLIEGYKPRDYCVDYQVKFDVINGTIVGRKLRFILLTIGDAEENIITYFNSIGMLTSCFFLFLLLLVYWLLPPLRNIGGMVLMAYASSVFLFYLVRAVLPLVIARLTSTDCKKISPVLYFATLSQFFWLNIMSFDLFWAFRGTRKCRAIHRQGENVKFRWYCLYAWGIPLLITIASVILDNIDIKKYGLLAPRFSSCGSTDKKTKLYYLHIPIGIIIVINTLLFFMTVYNIWLIKREIRTTPESRNTKKDMNNFKMHVKLAVMMGISWSIEILSSIMQPKWLDSTFGNIVVNFYHVFIGVFIFFLFVFKKKIFFMLCKKFHLNYRLGRNLQESYQYSRSGTGPKTVRRYTFKSSRSEGP